jgi:hypothetical protein
MAIFFDHNPISGAVETFDYDEMEDKITIKRYADVQPVIDLNKYSQNHETGWVGPERDMRLAARIPEDVALLWLQLYGVNAWRADHWPAVKRLLNDPDWRYLRSNTYKL